MDQNPNVKFVDISNGLADGQVKCPKCGATDISQNSKTGRLRCNFCRHEFEVEAINQDTEDDIFSLQGETIYTGMKDINQSASDMVTIKCQSCGAEVVIDTNQSTQARCHWCRNTLSINSQIENGAVPDMVLPFSLPKAEAQSILQKYIDAHKFFALPAFTREFNVNNIMGVYFPYMMVDANTHVTFEGTGEIEKRRYTVGSGDNEETRYDADLYELGRQFDMGVDDLTIESSSARMDGSKESTNNIINAILPFDTENCVQYNANYLKGYTSEKRDVDIEDMRPYVNEQIADIARYQAKQKAQQYDRGICWDRQDVDIKGLKWVSAYLPVWLYSYQQKKGNQSILHFVAVNARTKETVGSIPINKTRLIAVSAAIEAVAFAICVFLTPILMFSSDSDDDGTAWYWILMLAGFIFYWIQYSRYRNQDERHFHEKETRSIIKNATGYDTFVQTKKGLSNATYDKANDDKVGGVIIKAGEKGMAQKIANKAMTDEQMHNVKQSVDQNFGGTNQPPQQ